MIHVASASSALRVFSNIAKKEDPFAENTLMRGSTRGSERGEELLHLKCDLNLQISEAE